MNDFQKKLLIRLGVTIGSLAILLGILLYIGGDIQAVNKSIQSVRTSLVTRSQAIGNLVDLKKDSEEAKKGLSFLQNALPARESLFVFSDEVSRLAKQRSLSAVFNFGLEVPGSATAPGKMGFTINVSGEYNSIIDFMKDFEASRYFTSVNSLELVSQGANTTGYQVMLAGDVFYKFQ